MLQTQGLKVDLFCPFQTQKPDAVDLAAENRAKGLEAGNDKLGNPPMFGCSGICSDWTESERRYHHPLLQIFVKDMLLVALLQLRDLHGVQERGCQKASLHGFEPCVGFRQKRS